MTKGNLVLNDKFLWGGASASYQAEGAWNVGGKGVSVWDNFSHNSDFNINNVTGDDAVDFYHKFEEDIKLFKECGQNSFRFSIAWTRILPNGSGEVSQEGIDFYNRVIDTCLANGIEPNVTIFHYDIPYRYEQEFNGWESREMIDLYLNFAKVCFEAFGDRVKLWSTINEPRFYSFCGNVVGNWPPHKHKDFQAYWVTTYNEMVASAKAVKLFRDMGIKGHIGIVHDSGRVDVAPQTKDKEYVYDHAQLFFNGIVLDMCCKGIIPPKLEEYLKADGLDTSFIDYADEAVLKEGLVDYIGLNVYQRYYVTDFTGDETIVTHNNKGKESKTKEGIQLKGWFAITDAENDRRNQWGREVYPECLYDIIVDTSEKYPGFPIVVTENGHAMYDTPDENGYVEDDERIEVLNDFIDAMLKAKHEGYDVQGYYVWSATDVWSWVNGYEKRYGVIRVDQNDDYKRIPKKSFYWYKDKIAQNQIPLGNLEAVTPE